MYKIECLSDNNLYIKVLGKFPKSVAGSFIEEFERKTSELEQFSVIVDCSDLIFLKLESFQIILDLLVKDNDKLDKSAFVISENQLLKEEARILLEKVESGKRKIVSTIDGAKEWIGLKEIVFHKTDTDSSCSD